MHPNDRHGSTGPDAEVNRDPCPPGAGDQAVDHNAENDEDHPVTPGVQPRIGFQKPKGKQWDASHENVVNNPGQGHYHWRAFEDAADGATDIGRSHAPSPKPQGEGDHHRHSGTESQGQTGQHREEESSSRAQDGHDGRTEGECHDMGRFYPRT